MNSSYGATFLDESALARAVGELARIGLARETLTVAARQEKTLAALVRDLGVRRIDAGVHHEGMFADLARATGQREPTPPDALERELIAHGIDEERARYFDGQVRDGAILLIVPASDNEDALGSIVGQGGDLGLVNGAGLVTTIPLRREVLDVRKIAVPTSEVIVRTEIIVETKTIELELEREEFVIERFDPRTPGVAPHITRIPIRHEEAVVRKETFVTGEVRVHTEQHVDVSTIEETLRHEVLRVDEPVSVDFTARSV